MLSLFSAGARAQLRTLLASLIVLAIGVWEAPHLGGKTAVAVAFLIGVIALIVRTIQAWKPAFSFVKYLGHPFGDWADAFLQGFLGTLLVTLTGSFYAPDLHTARAFLVSAIVGAFNAGVRAVQGLLTTNESPAPATGIKEPAMPYSYEG
jgi:hypothetical protein